MNAPCGSVRISFKSNYKSLFQNIVSFMWLFSKETYNLIHPTNRSHPMSSTAYDVVNLYTLICYIPEDYEHGHEWHLYSFAHVCISVCVCVNTYICMASA